MQVPKHFMAALALMLILFVLMIYYAPFPAHRVNINKYTQPNYLIKPYALPREQFYHNKCFLKEFYNSIHKLPENIFRWSISKNDRCLKLLKKFQTMFEINLRKGDANISREFIKRTYDLTEGTDELYYAFKNQLVIEIKNRYTREQIIFNSIRSRRPMLKPEQDNLEYFNTVVLESRDNCLFCNYETMTATDVFGRIYGRHSVTATNAYRLEKWHGLIFPKEHDLTKINEEEFLDLFNTTIKWFNKANSIDRESCHPMVVFDTLHKGGASQIHLHLHPMLSNQYLTVVKIQEEAAINYKVETGNDYWSDFIEIHHALGLATVFGNAVAISPLTSLRKYEIMILSTRPDTDVFRLYYHITQTYYRKLKSICFSSGLAFPPMCPKYNEPSFPTHIRIGSRGACNTVRSDVGSLELYVAPSVSTDPYVIIQHLRDTLDEVDSSDSQPYEKMVHLTSS